MMRSDVVAAERRARGRGEELDGTQGRAAIYTNPHSGFAILRRIGIRAYRRFNWVYPFPG